MNIPVWHNADPFFVAIDDGGGVEIRLGEELVGSHALKPVSRFDEAGSDRLLRLRGSATAPSQSPWSWVNERGRGQIVVVENERVLACHLRGRLPRSPLAARPAENPHRRHPMAGFWLSLAMTVHRPVSLASLVALSGYSYPTIHEWTKRESLAGRLTATQGRGRGQVLDVLPRAQAAWWATIKAWWPVWRSEKWPKRHGAGEVYWGRARSRLPSMLVGKHQADTRWTGTADGDGWIYATGADHLAVSGALIQPYDSDVWIGRSAWNAIKEQVRMVDAPKGDDRWPATRFTVVDDDHPLMRLAWFAAGSIHPHGTDDVQALLETLERLSGLFAGLPLLDAIHHPDARVVECGHDKLARFEQELNAS